MKPNLLLFFFFFTCVVHGQSFLGPDRTICEEDSIVLNPDIPDALYEWQDGSTEQTLIVKESGRYWVVIDNDGVITTDTVDLIFGTMPALNLGEDIYRCRLDEPLEFNFTHRNTTYEWQDGSTEPNYIINEAGLFWVTIIDTITGCTNTDTLRIGLDYLGLDVITFNNPTCYGLADGSITVGTSGNSEECDFLWVPENIIGGATFNNLTRGEYFVIANDGDCIDSMYITLEWPDSLFADIVVNDALCYGDSSGYVVVETVYNAQNDLNNISYFWAPNFMGVEGVGIDSGYHMPIGEYTLLINDDNGCSFTIDFEIDQPTEMKFAEIGFEPAYCRLFNYQSGNGIVYASVNGGIPDYEYKWEYLLDGSFTNNSTWGARNPGTYKITATDNQGCELIQIVELDSVSPIADFDVISDQLDHNLEGTEVVEATFVNTSLYFSNPIDPSTDTTFFWNLYDGEVDWQISHSYFETFDSTYIGEFIYDVCLVAINKNGCKDTTCKPLIVHVKPEFDTPNIFTPNGDGVNEIFTFEFRTLGIKDFNCIITNRWGVQVGEITDVLEGWDGNNMNGDPCSDGVYFYVFEAVATNHTEFNGTGTVQLVRHE
ncbi:T9SS type B sorting domain-containing protein [Crocinitomix catalasitica]|uniref:T9SS type B sorting domain-containing protein n=1 Tax=Crocinitomix catalasitica TaxID=184607 RepID=UPI000483BA82|nr:gliding motility-associated C-terminal domain-containing protein [Crocinitomix catalasitica]